MWLETDATQTYNNKRLHNNAVYPHRLIPSTLELTRLPPLNSTEGVIHYILETSVTSSIIRFPILFVLGLQYCFRTRVFARDTIRRTHSKPSVDRSLSTLVDIKA